MKKYIIIIILLLSVRNCISQSISPNVINTAGVAGVIGNIYIEFNLGETFTATFGNSNYVTQGLLQPVNIQSGPLPVSGLDFMAKRINPNTVRLDWKTSQEINNHGFYAERKKDNEPGFTNINFIPSSAISGNSSLPLTYVYSDANNYPGKTYYRLRQVDRDSQYVYSVIRMVNGAGKKVISMKAWPVPSSGPVQVSVEGIEDDQLLVFDNTGRLIQSLKITPQKIITLQNLRPGTYIIKPSSQRDISQAIIIQ